MKQHLLPPTPLCCFYNIYITVYFPLRLVIRWNMTSAIWTWAYSQPLKDTAQKALVIIWGQRCQRVCSQRQQYSKNNSAHLFLPCASEAAAGSTVLESSPKGCDMKANDISHASWCHLWQVMRMERNHVDEVWKKWRCTQLSTAKH